MIDWTGTRAAKDPLGTLARIKRSGELERTSKEHASRMELPISGPRGGLYRMATTRDGRSYRRYF